MVLRLAGNDVVDLGDPANAGAHERARFVMRVCGEHERRALAWSTDPAALLWSFFAAKEAAFKLACKLGPRPVFAHRLFVVEPTLTAVRHGELVFHLEVEREGDLVHAVAWTGDDRPRAIARAVDPSEDLGIAARRLLVRSLTRDLHCSPAMLAVVRDPAPDAWDDLGPPRLLRYGLPVAVDVSLSHDGRFVGCSAYLPLVLTPPSSETAFYECESVFTEAISSTVSKSISTLNGLSIHG